MIDRYSIIMQSLYSKDTRVTKCRPITHTSLQYNKTLLPIVGDRYPRRRMWKPFDSLIMSIEAFDPPSYSYNSWNDNEEILCKLFLLEECIFIYLNIMWTRSSKNCSWWNDNDNSQGSMDFIHFRIRINECWNKLI